MEIKGNTIFIDKSENLDEIVIKFRDDQQSSDEQQSYDENHKISFNELLSKFNQVLIESDHKPITKDMKVYGYVAWSNHYADMEWDKRDSIFFKQENFPLIYNYRGTEQKYKDVAYTAMVSWLIAMQLSEIAPSSGQYDNTQTKLFSLAFSLGGGQSVPMTGLDIHSDPWHCREAAGFIYAVCHTEYTFDDISIFRKEIGGSSIPASLYSELGYSYTELKDTNGNRTGYRVNNVGYLVNTDKFIPYGAGPRVKGTGICSKSLPEGELNQQTKNFISDETIDRYMVSNYNMGSETPLSEWNSYDIKKQNRIVNCAAVPSCTYMYMFGKPKNIRFKGIEYKTYDGETYGNYYCFEQTSDNTGLTLSGPFSNLSFLYRYNIPDNQMTLTEKFIENTTEVADNSRFPTYDTCYGRCRPCGNPNLIQGGARSEVNGAKENAIYNVDIACMVVDNEKQYQKCSHQDGFVKERPASYPSGHSAQIWMLGILISQMDVKNIETYMKKCYEYSVNRSVGRFHWNSDCMIGRLFGTMSIPLIMAMDGMRSGFEDMQKRIQNQDTKTTELGQDININISIKNNSKGTVTLSGEINFVLANPDIYGNYYGWKGIYNRTGRIKFNNQSVTMTSGSEKKFCNIHCPEMGLRNLLDGSKMSQTSYKTNILLYDTNGESGNIEPENVSSDIQFTDGMTLEIKIIK